MEIETDVVSNTDGSAKVTLVTFASESLPVGSASVETTLRNLSAVLPQS